jgi:rod shape-determining protein MreC
MKRQFGLKKYIYLLLLVAVFLVFNLTGFSKSIKNFFYVFSSPIQKTFWNAGIGFSDFFGSIFEGSILKEENTSLHLKIQELVGEIAALKELKKENEDLRGALDIGLAKEFQLMFCNIISKDISQDSILVNKGSKDGISKGLPVITPQKIILGRIGEVYDNFSEVILIYSEKSFFDAKISDKEISGVVKGKGNSGAYVDLIPKEKEILSGDVVITSSLGGNFPKGLLVGTIKEVKKSDVEAFQTADIEIAFNVKNLDGLFIVTDF